MQIMNIRVEKENHIVDVKFSKKRKRKLIKNVEYILYKGIKIDIGIIKIINSLEKEKILFFKKYSSFIKAETDYNIRVRKFMGESIFNFCLNNVEQRKVIY